MRVDDYNRIARDTPGAKPIYLGGVVSIHGMKTRGTWQKEINATLQDNFLRHIQIDYGYQVPRGFWPLTKGLLNEVLEQIVAAYEEQARFTNKICAIAHSFGTLAIGSALRWTPDLKIRRIILVASILPRNFPWDDLQGRGQIEQILNETCRIDIWPRLARFSISGAGPSGCHGFLPNRPWVTEQPYSWTEHSRLPTRLHCSNVWVPFILG